MNEVDDIPRDSPLWLQHLYIRCRCKLLKIPDLDRGIRAAGNTPDNELAKLS